MLLSVLAFTLAAFCVRDTLSTDVEFKEADTDFPFLKDLQCPSGRHLVVGKEGSGYHVFGCEEGTNKVIHKRCLLYVTDITVASLSTDDTHDVKHDKNMPENISNGADSYLTTYAICKAAHNKLRADSKAYWEHLLSMVSEVKTYLWPAFQKTFGDKAELLYCAARDGGVFCQELGIFSNATAMAALPAPPAPPAPIPPPKCIGKLLWRQGSVILGCQTTDPDTDAVYVACCENEDLNKCFSGFISPHYDYAKATNLIEEGSFSYEPGAPDVKEQCKKLAAITGETKLEGINRLAGHASTKLEMKIYKDDQFNTAAA